MGESMTQLDDGRRKEGSQAGELGKLKQQRWARVRLGVPTPCKGAWGSTEGTSKQTGDMILFALWKYLYSNIAGNDLEKEADWKQVKRLWK